MQYNNAANRSWGRTLKMMFDAAILQAAASKAVTTTLQGKRQQQAATTSARYSNQGSRAADPPARKLAKGHQDEGETAASNGIVHSICLHMATQPEHLMLLLLVRLAQRSHDRDTQRGRAAEQQSSGMWASCNTLLTLGVTHGRKKCAEARNAVRQNRCAPGAQKCIALSRW